MGAVVEFRRIALSQFAIEVGCPLPLPQFPVLLQFLVLGVALLNSVNCLLVALRLSVLPFDSRHCCLDSLHFCRFFLGTDPRFEGTLTHLTLDPLPIKFLLLLLPLLILIAFIQSLN